MATDKLMRVGLKAFIEKDGKLLVLFDPKGRLDLPGGKIQDGEIDFLDALRREAVEEINVEITIGDPFVTWQNIEVNVFLVGYRCAISGGEFALSPAHLGFEWITKADLTRFEKENYYVALEKYFENVNST